MPRVTPSLDCIVVPVSDRIPGVIKQKARMLEMLHTQQANGTCAVKIKLEVKMYHANGEDFGDPIEGLGFSAYTEYLKADNDTIVDAATGQILQMKKGENIPEWQAAADAYEQPVMFQGDFFYVLRENQPLLIGQMLRQHIAQADAMGRFSHPVA